ncbi:hypothetical protein ABQE93_10520 [Mycolicibacterium sp. XJ662]
MAGYRAWLVCLAVLSLAVSACSQTDPQRSAPEHAPVPTTVSGITAAPQPGMAPSPIPEEPATPLSAVRQAPAVNPADYEQSSWTTGPLRPTPGFFTFTTPSGNITCTWEQTGGDRLICGLKARSSEPTPRPASCEDYLAWNTNHVTLTAAGAVDGVCTGGAQVPSAANELQYGLALIAGDYGCLSEEAGVTCVNIESGSGFFVSREQFIAY